MSEFKFLTQDDIFEIFLKYPIFKKDENGFPKIMVKSPNSFLDSVVEFRHNNIFIYPIYEKDKGRFLEDIIHLKISKYGGYMITESYIDSIAQFIVKQLKEIEVKNKKLNIEQDF